MAERMAYINCPGQMLKELDYPYTTQEKKNDRGETYYVHTAEIDVASIGTQSVKVRSGAGGACGIWCYPVLGVPVSRRAAVLEKLNSLMDQYRFVRFVLDEDRDVCASIDFWQAGDERAAVRIARLSMMTFVSVLENCVPEILKTLYREEQDEPILKMNLFADEEE